MSGTLASGLPGNVTTSESDSERKHVAQVQAQRAARRLQKKQRSVDAGCGSTVAGAGGGGSSGQLQVDRQKLSPGLRPQRRLIQSSLSLILRVLVSPIIIKYVFFISFYCGISL